MSEDRPEPLTAKAIRLQARGRRRATEDKPESLTKKARRLQAEGRRRETDEGPSDVVPILVTNESLTTPRQAKQLEKWYHKLIEMNERKPDDSKPG